ncbi:MAG: 2Fe-2S iron-sulfur cluster binding domain-containing protein [Xanthomonadales bacterium]|nr:2Fe-2S iron-sulfur cluster binding domain-containing protein [Xanthomonadales bacterium]
MTAQVRILPSGHEFESEGHASLLEAGLSAGLRLSYGCSNGNCGKCLAKVVSGEVEKTRHHDFRIGEANKLNGHILMCSNTALTDVVLEAQEASSASEIPQQQITARVKNVSIANHNVALVHLRTPRTNRLRFLAGQHVELGGNGKPGAIHTVASCPCDDMHLHFQIPMNAADNFSNHVFRTLKTGDSLDIRGPNGDFILDEDSPRSLVFIAGRTGFAPVRSLIEHAMALEVAKAIHLLWIAESKKDRYLDNLCRSWADALDDFYYIPVDARPRTTETDIRSGFGQLDIKQHCLLEHDFYIAGNQSLLDESREILHESGVPSQRLKLDSLLHN